MTILQGVFTITTFSAWSRAYTLFQSGVTIKTRCLRCEILCGAVLFFVRFDESQKQCCCLLFLVLSLVGAVYNLNFSLLQYNVALDFLWSTNYVIISIIYLFCLFILEKKYKTIYHNISKILKKNNIYL